MEQPVDDPRDGADLVLHALDLDARDRAALQARQQDAPQAFAHRHAEAAPGALSQLPGGRVRGAGPLTFTELDPVKRAALFG